MINRAPSSCCRKLAVSDACKLTSCEYSDLALLIEDKRLLLRASKDSLACGLEFLAEYRQFLGMCACYSSGVPDPVKYNSAVILTKCNADGRSRACQGGRPTTCNIPPSPIDLKWVHTPVVVVWLQILKGLIKVERLHRIQITL